MLNTDEAYAIDVSAVTDVLTSGLYVKESPMVIKGFDSLEHTLEIITDAATVKALHPIYAAGAYAIWQVYQQPTGEPEAFYGYLVVSMSDDTIASIDADNELGDDTISDAEFAAIILDYFASDERASYDGSDDITDSVDTAKGKIRFEVPE